MPAAGCIFQNFDGIAVQDASQLKLNYGRELADVIVNICGNIIVGQVGGDLAKQFLKDWVKHCRKGKVSLSTAVILLSPVPGNWQDIVDSIMEIVLNDPSKQHLVVRRG